MLQRALQVASVGCVKLCKPRATSRITPRWQRFNVVAIAEPKKIERAQAPAVAVSDTLAELDDSLIAASLAVIMQPSRKRRRGMDAFLCPSCNQECLRVETLGNHLLRCCPDLLSRQAGAARRRRQFPDAFLQQAAGAAVTCATGMDCLQG